jgi:16S rRNA (cytidine1402-2'-O)-methyltransferase
MSDSPGKLILVGTPIGNLGDITYRAAKTLAEVDFICAEDTRVTQKLLNHLNIKKQLISYQDHSGDMTIDYIIGRIRTGETAAEVTDAGMPSVSDPGERLVESCITAGIEVDVVPGATALTTAAALSGMNVKRFAFEGFLSVTKKKRYEHLESLVKDPHTLIFYEAPHKLLTTLHDLLDIFGEREIAVCRELTKIHQEVLRTNLSGAIETFNERTPKGEFVLIISGYKALKQTEEDYSETLEKAVRFAQNIVAEQRLKPSEACKIAAAEYKIKKADIYAILAK